jgi:hypothetical protein
VNAQTTLANFDFNGGTGYPISASSTASNITASINGTQSNAAYSGTATGSGAFIQNTTAGNALSMSNSSGTNSQYWTLTLGGSALSSYASYHLYLQSEHSTTGATAITVLYSTDNSTYTALSQTIAPGLNTTFTEAFVDLSSISTLNGAGTIYLRFAASGASGSGTLRIDNLQVQGSLAPWTTSGTNVTFNGTVTAPTLTVSGDARVNGTFTGNSIITNSLNSINGISTSGLSVSGSASIGTLSTNTLNVNTLTLNGSTMGVGYIPASGSIGPRLLFGNQTPPSPQNITCNNTTNGTSGLYNMFGDGAQFYNYWGSTTANQGRRVLTVGTDYSGASIDLAGTKDDGTAGVLLMNYYCGKDIAICTNPSNGGGSNTKGGVVSMGQNVQIGTPISDYNTALNVNANSSNAFKIQNGSGNTTIFNIDNAGKTFIGSNNNSTYSSTKMLTVNGDVSLANYSNGSSHTNDGFSGIEILGNSGVPTRRGLSVDADPDGDFNFYINSNQSTSEFNFKNSNGSTNLMSLNSFGQLILGTKSGNANLPTSNSGHYSALLVVKGESVSQAHYVTQNNWADFVFDKNFKLMPLSEVESFYKQNHHLPNVPTTQEVQTNGNNLGETDAILLQKIEELTLYIVELKKEVEALKKNNK